MACGAAIPCSAARRRVCPECSNPVAGLACPIDVWRDGDPEVDPTGVGDVDDDVSAAALALIVEGRVGSPVTTDVVAVLADEVTGTGVDVVFVVFVVDVVDGVRAWVDTSVDDGAELVNDVGVAVWRRTSFRLAAKRAASALVGLGSTRCGVAG